MILSKEKINSLLSVFSSPKSVAPYDIFKEKTKIENSNILANNYHIYGYPSEDNPIIISDPININNNDDINLYTPSILNNSKSPKQLKKVLINPVDREIKQSLTNLKAGLDYYKKQQELNNSRNQYQSYIRQSKSSSNIFKPSYFHNNDIFYEEPINQNISYSQYTNNNGMYYKSGIIKNNSMTNMKLKHIPSNPEDVVIKEIPKNIIPLKRISVTSSNIANPLVNTEPIKIIPIKRTSATSDKITSKLPNTESIISQLNTNNEIAPVVPVVPVIQKTDEMKEISLKEEESFQDSKKEETPKYNGIYKITAINGPIKIPEGYSTNDVDEYNAIQMINDNLSTWKLLINKPDYKIYTKPFKTYNEKGKEKESRMFYLDATINCPASEVNRQINTFELRKEWEDSLKKGQLINKEDLGNGIKTIDYYGYIKMPIIFADRDIVVRKKIWENYGGEKDCCLNELHSIELPEFPAKTRPLRARLENKSKYIKPINSHMTKFYYVNKFDLKLDLKGDVMESKGADKTEKWFKQFLSHL